MHKHYINIYTYLHIHIHKHTHKHNWINREEYYSTQFVYVFHYPYILPPPLGIELSRCIESGFKAKKILIVFSSHCRFHYWYILTRFSVVIYQWRVFCLVGCSFSDSTNYFQHKIYFQGHQWLSRLKPTEWVAQ